MSESDDRWAEARRANDEATWRLVRWFLAAMVTLVGLAVLVVWLVLR